MWLMLACIIIIFLLYGDIQSRNGLYISSEKAASIEYNQWPQWKTLEPPDNRIRMLWILHDYVPFVNAGSEICAHTINQYCMSKPYKYDIFVASRGFPQRTYENVRCFDLYDTTTLWNVIQSSHVLHTNTCLFRKQLIWISHKTGKPFVEWVHTDNYVRTIQKPWNDPRIQGRQWTVFNSRSLRNTRPDIPDETTKIIFPSVDFRNYGIDEEKRKPQYVTLSNVNENKGGHILIQLAKALPEMEFQGIIGGYRKQVVDKTIPNLRYIPHTTEIKEVYAQSWVQIMPSKEETWGRTAVEAMSSGIPLVVSPTPGLKECCKEAALYCERDDLESWVRTLRKLKMDREFYNKRSRLSLERARALDPNPSLADLESWLDTVVLPSAVKTTYYPTSLEKNLLFR